MLRLPSSSLSAPGGGEGQGEVGDRGAGREEGAGERNKRHEREKQMTAPAASTSAQSPRPSGATMEDIVALARAFAAARGATEALAEDIKALQRKALRSRLRALRTRIAEQAASEEALRTAILDRPDLFIRPRTVAVDGIRFGLRKQPGTVEVGDEAKAIRRLRERFPSRAEALIRVKETLDRSALRKLPAAELAQIGVTMEKATDEVTIAAASGDLDRVVAALLDDAAHMEAS